MQLNRIPFLDFLRSLSIVWLIGYHSYWFLGLLLKPQQVTELFNDGFSRFLFLGHNGVDIFFVLSGYLICMSAFSLRQKFPDRWIRAFFIKRAFRILPALICVAALAISINQFLPIAKNLHNLWANFLMINNFLPVAEQAMGWTWSLAIEEQFYLIFPFVVLLFASRPKSFLGLCLGLLIVSVAIKHMIFLVKPPLGETMPFHPILYPAEFADYFDRFYSQTYMRFGPIIVGIITFLISKKVQKNSLRWILLFCGLALAIAPLLINQIYFETVWQKTLFSIGIGLLIGAHPQAELKFIALPIWRKLALWSYSAFLINPLVILVLAIIHLRSDVLTSPVRMGFYLVLCQACTFALAALIYRWVEKPANVFGNDRKHFAIWR